MHMLVIKTQKIILYIPCKNYTLYTFNGIAFNEITPKITL